MLTLLCATFGALLLLSAAAILSACMIASRTDKLTDSIVERMESGCQPLADEQMRPEPPVRRRKALGST